MKVQKIAHSQPRINLLRAIYPEYDIEIKNDSNFENPSRSDSANMLSSDKGLVNHFRPDSREKKIDEVKTKLSKGYYSQHKVYSKIAERIIDTLT